MSYSEVYRLPVAYRKWFISRLVQDFKQRKNAIEGNNTDESNHSNMDKLKQFEDMLSKKS
jgi:hypothetical protein